jgi:hypothetical protein
MEIDDGEIDRHGTCDYRTDSRALLTGFHRRCTHQNPDAMRAENADDDGHDRAEDEASIVERVRHRENSRAERTLQQMEQRAESPAEDLIELVHGWGE